MPPKTKRGTRSRVMALLGTVVFLAALSTACDIQPVDYETSVPQPEGPHPRRYVDPVFTDVAKVGNITYSTADDLEGNPVDLKLTVYHPKGDTVTDRPVIVDLHGGGFFTSDHEVPEGLANYYATEGYVVILPEYRLLAPSLCGQRDENGDRPEGCDIAAMAAMTDAASVVRWVRLHASELRINPNQIVMTGDSAGAVTSMGVGLLWGMIDEYMDNVQEGAPQNPAAIGLLRGAPVNTSNPGPSSGIVAWGSLSGAFPDRYTSGEGNIFDYKETHWPEARPRPGIMFHGTADEPSPIQTARATRDAFGADGVLVIYEEFEGLGHVSPIWRDPVAGEQLRQQSTWFFAYMLQLA